MEVWAVRSPVVCLVLPLRLEPPRLPMGCCLKPGHVSGSLAAPLEAEWLYGLVAQARVHVWLTQPRSFPSLFSSITGDARRAVDSP